MKSKKKNTTVFSSAFLAIALVIVILLNIAGVLAGEKFNLNADFTLQKVYSLTNETKEAIATIDKETKVYVLTGENEFISASAYFKQANDVLNHFPKVNENISIEYIDLNKNPGFLNNYKNVTLYQGDLLIVQGDSYVGIPSSRLFHLDESTDQVYIRSSRAESALTSALLSLNNPDTKVVSFATDKEAYEASSVTYLLEDNYYISRNFEISSGSVPEETDVLVLFSPMEDYTREDVTIVREFLNRPNKSVIYIADLEQPVPTEMPNLMSFLQENGIVMDDGVVYETDNRNIYDNNPYAMRAAYEYYSVAGKVPESGLYPVVPFARPLRVGTPLHRDVKVLPLLRYASSSVVRPENASSSWNATEEETQNNLKAMVMAQIPKGDDTYSNLLVIPSASYFSSNNLVAADLSNAEYFVTLLNHLTQRTDAAAIADKSLSSSNFTITQSQVSTLMVFFAIFLPLAILLMGTLVWLRRRKQ